MIKILYLHNGDDWAIHNVGKLWFFDIDSAEVVIKNYHTIDKNEVYSYDYVWYGYSLMYLKLPHDLDKTILSLHDPLELFPQVPDWKKKPPILERVNLLKSAYKVVTTSMELKDILVNLKINCTLIPTSSTLPMRNMNKIKTNGISLLSVFEDYPRKNYRLLELIKEDFSSNKKINFTFKVGKKILPENEYINILDLHNVYICTSFQEGGPLPAFDAMKRGLVILTTKVGQIQELVVNGFNGFICKDKDDFVCKIKYLTNDPDKLHQMRVNAVKHIQENRNPRTISKCVNAFISNLGS